MAEQKYKKNFDDLGSDKQMDLYSEAYNYITSVNKLDKVPPPNRIAPPGQEFNISNDKTAEAFTNFAKENDPEGFAKIQKIIDDINNKNELENFNVKDREPNKDGGLNHLLGF
jgi:protoporphyrinogen oxidase